MDTFTISNNGKLLVAKELDHETISNYSLTVEVGDAVGNTTNATVSVEVSDVDEQSPTIDEQSFTIGKNASVGMIIGEIEASDNVGVVGYSITSGDNGDFFAIANDGNLRTVRVLNYETKGSYALMVEVRDAVENKATATIMVGVRM